MADHNRVFQAGDLVRQDMVPESFGVVVNGPYTELGERKYTVFVTGEDTHLEFSCSEGYLRFFNE